MLTHITNRQPIAILISIYKYLIVGFCFFYIWNYNIMAIWPHHVISLVITFNIIPLDLPIVFPYYFISDNSLY